MCGDETHSSIFSVLRTIVNILCNFFSLLTSSMRTSHCAFFSVSYLLSGGFWLHLDSKSYQWPPETLRKLRREADMVSSLYPRVLPVRISFHSLICLPLLSKSGVQEVDCSSSDPQLWYLAKSNTSHPQWHGCVALLTRCHLPGGLL